MTSRMPNVKSSAYEIAPEVNNLDKNDFKIIQQNVKYYRDIYTVLEWKYVQNNPCNIGKQVSTKMLGANADQTWRSHQCDRKC